MFGLWFFIITTLILGAWAVGFTWWVVEKRSQWFIVEYHKERVAEKEERLKEKDADLLAKKFDLNSRERDIESKVQELKQLDRRERELKEKENEIAKQCKLLKVSPEEFREVVASIKTLEEKNAKLYLDKSAAESRCASAVYNLREQSAKTQELATLLEDREREAASLHSESIEHREILGELENRILSLEVELKEAEDECKAWREQFPEQPPEDLDAEGRVIWHLEHAREPLSPGHLIPLADVSQTHVYRILDNLEVSMNSNLKIYHNENGSRCFLIRRHEEEGVFP